MTIRARLEKARLEVNALRNTASRALYAIDKALEECCGEHDHGGHHHDHPTPTPAPIPTGEPFHDVRFEDFVTPTQPRPAGELDEGAFRYTANIAWIAAIDPIVAPGTRGQVHLHMGWGNTALDENSTYETLSTSGSSTITGDKLFRSGEWVPPPIFDEIGMVWRADVVSGYYKLAAPEQRPQGYKELVNVPAGLKLIYGNTMTPKAQSKKVRFHVWSEDFKTGIANGLTLEDVLEHLTPGRKLRVELGAPDCWDGVNLDSADHRSHMAYTYRDNHTGKMLVPESHPYLIPTITRFLDFTVPDLPKDVLQAVRLSSDMPGYPAGSSMHGDYIECIHPEARKRMFEAMLAQKNCSASDFGDGWQGVRPAGFTFEQRPNLIPVP